MTNQQTMENKKSPAIVFDLGNVLIGWNPRPLFEEIFNNDQKKVDYFFDNVCTVEWNEKQDAGRPIAEAVQERIALFPEHEEPIRAYYDRWIETISGPIDGTVEILSQLKEGGHDLSALSNWSAETFPLVEAKYQFLGWFEEKVISGRVGLKKPDPKIYELLLEQVGRPAEECLFIDDSEKNIVAANQLGFDTIHFISPEQLRSELEKRSLITSR
ncbi:MAG: HAD family hydrolase [Anaerolineae bacterium]